MDMTQMMQQAGTIPQAPQGALPQAELGTVLNGGGLENLVTAPPRSVEEVQGRKAAWQQVLDNPNMKSALLRMGLQMMQGRRAGESTAGAVGRIGINGMDYFAAKQELDRRRGIEQQKLDLDTRATNSQIANRNADTAHTIQATTEDAAKHAEWTQQAGHRQQKAQLEIDNLIKQGKLDEARMKAEQYKLDDAEAKKAFLAANPGLRDAALKAELERPAAELLQTRAQTAASNASAANASASAAKSQEELAAIREGRANMPAWIAALPDKEAQAYAQANKDVKPQAEIMQDIRERKHHGFVDDRSNSSSLDLMGYEGAAEQLVAQYNEDPNKGGKSFDTWIGENRNPTIGKSSGAVIALAKQKLAAQGSGSASAAVPPPEQRVVGKKYQTPKGELTWTKEGWIK